MKILQENIVKTSSKLKKINIVSYKTYSDVLLTNISLSYQLFGLPLGKAPIVMVNHALTGNSNVSGENGWWKDIIGDNKIIDTQKYTILAFNIPGNGYDGNIITNYKDFIARDIAELFLLGLQKLNITKLFSLIGSSLGGGIAWEMIALNPKIISRLIVIATDWKATDWLIANCQIQEQFLGNSKNPVHDARMHAMLCYRTPKSFKTKFQRSKNKDLNIFNVESWLLHHGEKLQQEFQLSAYKLMNQLLKTIDVTNGRTTQILNTLKTPIHIIAIDSDLFFSAEENKETHKKLAITNPNVTYNEIISEHGHDAFLIENKQLEQLITPIFNPNYKTKKMKVVKFGGKSLANGNGLKSVLSIIEKKTHNGEKLAIVVSARGNATDELETILKKAANNESYKQQLKAFKKYQSDVCNTLNFSEEFTRLDKLFEGVALLGDYSQKIKDKILSQGELLAVKTVTELLKQRNIKANAIDIRNLIKTDENFGNAQPISKLSKENVQKYFKNNTNNNVSVLAGFIASNIKNETTTLGRNGSNYTASLLANYLEAEELQNYTHVNGIYTANPDLVKNAKKITALSFSEANELANFGTNILHAKTIIPLLEKNISLRILNTFNLDDEGTLISSKTTKKGTKSLSVIENSALINFEGRGLLGKVGVDARIFKALSEHDVNVSIISQGSSERGIGLIIAADKASTALIALEREFENDFLTRDVHKIEIIDNVSVISLIGIEIKTFNKPFNALVNNNIIPILFNNTTTGKNVSLVVKKSQLHKALNVLHREIFEVSKTLNIAVFGHGLIGGTLINQLITSRKEILKRKGINLNIFAIANSTKITLKSNGFDENWEKELKNNEQYTLETLFQYIEKHHLENLVAIDNTASKDIINNYIPLIKNGFDLVSSNKIANSSDLKFYNKLRTCLKENQKKYLYEANVCAGLPLISTIKLLHLSGENITRIRGVFSGSLSYLFNAFSESENTFSTVLKEAIKKGYTEPDPREDLNGNDVARKLLILARELDLVHEIEDVKVQNLIPSNLRDISTKTFLESLSNFDTDYQKLKQTQKQGYVLRYVGEISGDLVKDEAVTLEVKLASISINSPLGQLKKSDTLIEIYTESYGLQPIVIQGAGAGAAVTARGVFGDILKLINKH